jgi:tetratricopeptide (TPR) repeat protein
VLEIERRALEQFAVERTLASLDHLLALYQWTGREDKIRDLLTLLIEEEAGRSPERKARLYVYLGQSRQRTGAHAEAAIAYEAALSFHPRDAWSAYFANNNLASCLNQLERYAQAEEAGRRAISLNPYCPHGWRNIGTSLEGLSDLAGAFSAFVQATRYYPADCRACELLENLVEGHPELLDIPGARAKLAECRRAVAFARDASDWRRAGPRVT